MKKLTLLAALTLAGCATTLTKPTPLAESNFVAVFVAFNPCDNTFIEAAFVRADGTIVEVTDEKQALDWDKPIAKEHGRMVPFYVSNCPVAPEKR